MDTAAVARVVAKIGRLLIAHPEIDEIDVNPLIAYRMAARRWPWTP